MEALRIPASLKAQHEKLCLNTSFEGPIKHSQTPITTTTSVVAIACSDGVVMAADTLGSYGSFARFRNCPRLLKVNDRTLIGCTGDYADYQYLKGLIEQRAIDDDCKDDGFIMSGRSLHCWLTRVLYNKRSEFDPLWTTFVVAGIEEDGKPFLGFVDKLGTAYKDPIICTGYGGHIATPLLRKEKELKEKDGGTLTVEEAKDILKRCMNILYYRDARAFDKYQIAVVPKEGVVSIDAPISVTPDWSISSTVRGYE